MDDATPQPSDVLPATTTAEEDRKTGGQRRVNLLWELTQTAIATAVVLTALWIAQLLASMATRVDATEQQIALAITAFMFLSNVASMVIGFYFGRTNHARTGGVGTTLGESR